MIDRNTRIAFIGGGNMASSMIGGLVAQGFPAQNIHVSEPVAVLADKLRTTYGVHVGSDNSAAIIDAQSPLAAHVVVLAVKPQVLKVVANGIAAAVARARPLVVTIAAGIRVGDLRRWLMEPLSGGSGSAEQAVSPSIVRVMPNTPALVLEGATGLWAGEEVTLAQRDLAFALMASFSAKTYWLETEALLDVVTGVSGSGPAYFFYLIEAMEQAAVELGMPREIARGLAAQTCMGAGKMALAGTMEDPAVLRRNVTSPNGTTAAAIDVFDKSGAKEIMAKAVVAATKRADELANILGQQ